MCEFVLTPLMAAFGGGAGAATAAGATAGAATAGTALQTFGTLVSIGGTIASAVGQNRAARATAARIEAQKATEKQINAVEDQRSRRRFLSLIRQQSATLLSRGISLNSPTAIALGEEAARELSFESQSIRSTGQARQRELTDSQIALRARGTLALLKGGFSAAGTLLDAAPDLWPGLAA